MHTDIVNDKQFFEIMYAKAKVKHGGMELNCT